MLELPCMVKTVFVRGNYILIKPKRNSDIEFKDDLSLNSRISNHQSTISQKSTIVSFTTMPIIFRNLLHLISHEHVKHNKRLNVIINNLKLP